jgi:hypothetical protein
MIVTVHVSNMFRLSEVGNETRFQNGAVTAVGCSVLLTLVFFDGTVW